MKIAPLWHALAAEPWAEARIIHTGQHYDFAMSEVFFRELGLPAPHVNLGVGSGTHGQQTGRVLEAYEAHLLHDRPDLVLVVGDVNATPAAALAAVKFGIPVAHLEAGLRSFDRSMPEEINRRMTDAICDFLWTPSEDADAHLLAEGIPQERITRVGNIMIDTLLMLRPYIDANPILQAVGLAERSYGVVTLHRPSNVDSKEQLKTVREVLQTCAADLPLVFPVHPRTRVRMEAFGLLDALCTERVYLLDPQPYTTFMRLVSCSKVVITDSGGVQEETSCLGIPCLTLRENTERPITVSLGTNQLVTLNQLYTCFREALKQEICPHIIPLWDGMAAHRVVKNIRKALFS